MVGQFPKDMDLEIINRGDLVISIYFSHFEERRIDFSIDHIMFGDDLMVFLVQNNGLVAIGLKAVLMNPIANC